MIISHYLLSLLYIYIYIFVIIVIVITNFLLFIFIYYDCYDSIMIIPNQFISTSGGAGDSSRT